MNDGLWEDKEPFDDVVVDPRDETESPGDRLRAVEPEPVQISVVAEKVRPARLPASSACIPGSQLATRCHTSSSPNCESSLASTFSM